MSTSRPIAARNARAARRGPRPASAAPPRRVRSRSSMNSHDCTVLALLLVERLSLTEAAVAMGVPVARLRRDYEAALVRVRRSIAPVVARADLARALTRPAPSR